MLDRSRQVERFPLASAIGMFALASIILAVPWLSGAVAIPYDAKSQFYPQLAFLARSLAHGESPFWTPNVFAGWPQIADPQSLIFSPIYFPLALLVPNPSPYLADVVEFGLLFIGGVGVILFFRDRGWHVAGAMVAAIAFSFGGSAASRIQHVGQIESLMFLPYALWLLSRALERSSWRAGAGAGLFGALIVLGRDQVSLLATYILIGFVLWHWFVGAGRQARFLASFKPLVAGLLVGLLIVAVPVTLTGLLAADSNRPEIGFVFAGRGSMHPADLFMLVFADLFGASDFHRDYWGPPSYPWMDAFGSTDLFVPQNAGQIYTGALAIVAVLGFGLLRGQLWAREIRFFSLAMLFTLLYELGKYTPAFQVMYDLLPGVPLYRRPADATFLFCGFLAIIAGYLIHRWLDDTMPPAKRWQHALAIVLAIALIAGAAGLASRVGTLQVAMMPILWGIALAAVAIRVLARARRLAEWNALAACALVALFSVVDFAWNNAPNESTGLPSANFDALWTNTKDETVLLLKNKLAASAAPDRRDRVELIGVAYHWPNIGLIHDFEHLFGHNPLRLHDFVRATAAPDTVAAPDQREFTPLLPSYDSMLENLFGVRFIAVSVPVEQVDKSLKPGDLPLIAHTKDAYVYENPRALPRVMLATDWRKADFEEMIRDGGWPEVDPQHTVLLEAAPPGFTPNAAGGTARIASYHNADIVIDVDAPAGGILVLNDIWHPWWRATVDGKPSDILKANVLFRAVVVAPGKHVVRFEFHPFTGALAELKEKFTGPQN